MESKPLRGGNFHHLKRDVTGLPDGLFGGPAPPNASLPLSPVLREEARNGGG